MPAGTKRNTGIIIAILAILSLVLSLVARWTPLFPGDLGLTLLLQSTANPGLSAVMETVSSIFGSWSTNLLVFFTGLFIWCTLGWLEGAFVWGAGLFSMIYEVFKLAISRPRPTAEQVEVLVSYSGYGFPSGHSFFAILFLGAIAWFLFTRLPERKWRIISLAALILLVLLVGVSRVYLGNHWPSDVLGGYVLGGLFLAILIRVYEIQKIRYRGGSIKTK